MQKQLKGKKKLKLKMKGVICPTCEGTGVNHYDDNNPCGTCKGDGMIEVLE